MTSLTINQEISHEIYAFKKKARLLLPLETNNFTVTPEATKEFFKPIYERELKLGNKRPEFNNLIWDWFEFKNQTISPVLPPDISVYVLLKKLTNEEILRISEKIGIKYFASWFTALEMIREIILSGKLDRDNNEAVVFFSYPQERDDAHLFFFSAKRINKELWVFFSPFIPNRKQSQGTQICFKSC